MDDDDSGGYSAWGPDFKTLCGWAILVLAVGVSLALGSWAGVNW